MAETFFTDDAQVQLHTGIDTLENLHALFSFLNAQMGKSPEKYTSSGSIPLFEQYCLTLMRFRLDLQPCDIASHYSLPEFDVIICIDRIISGIKKIPMLLVIFVMR